VVCLGPVKADREQEQRAPTRASALWITGKERAELRDEALPQLGPGQVLVRTVYSAVSRGTESLVFRGLVPESEYARMRCPHQAGEFPGPVKYGYSSVGRVLAGPDALVGQLVFCLHPHQTAYVVDEGAVLPLPDGVPPERAVLAANLETAVNACWDALPRVGDRVSVVGAGVVGSLVAYLMAGIPGVDVELIDVRPEQSAVAAAFGARFRLPAAASAGRDLVVHASATEAGLRRCLELAAPGASVLELSWFGATEVTLPLGGAFHVARLALRSSQVGTLSPAARPRFTHRERLALALALTADARLDVLFGPNTTFVDLPAALASLAREPRSGACQRVEYP